MKWFKWFLFPLYLIFWLITNVRNSFYELGWLKSSAFDLPIIGVGNITAGGTGKTPHTSYIASLLEDKFNIAILSKGYGRKSKDFQYVELNSNVIQVGDEPLQTKQNFPKQIVAVDHKRVNGVLKIIEENPETSVVILDDAYQHRSIKIGYNILLVNYNKPIYKDHLLPVGLLRESKKAIERADCVIVTKCPGSLNVKESEEIQKKLNFNGSVFFSSIIYGDIISLNDENNSINYTDFNNALVVTGIADATPLINHLSSKSISQKHLSFSDHYFYQEKDIKHIIQIFNTLEDKSIIITTEKDAQKLKKYNDFNQLPIYYLKVKVDFLWNKDKFDKKITNYVRDN